MISREKKLLQQAIELIEEQELHIAAEMLPAGRVLVEEIKAAISQQAEPECRCTMRQRLVGDGCAVCNPEYAADHEAGPCAFHDSEQAACQQYSGQVPCEQSPAQTVPVAQALRKMMTELEEIALIQPDCSKTELILKAVEALATRPAQTEQQPASWQFYQNGKWWNGDDRIKDHRENTEAAGIPVRDLYAAPIAQTTPSRRTTMAEQTENIVGMRKKIKAQAEHVRRLEQRIRELKQAAPQPEQEPFWYAVVSEQAPSINSAIKRLDVAQEFADSKRERWPDTRVVPLYAAPQPGQSGWVSAAERVPTEDDGEVLVLMDDGSCEIAWASYWHGASTGFACWTFRDPDEDRTPTHWMPLPAAQGAPQ